MAPPVQIYYWPMLLRNLPMMKMLDFKKLEYEHISDKAKMAELCSAFGATSGSTFAPPVLVDGDVVISQTLAICMYLGNKLNLTPDGYNEFKALQMCMDLDDTFNGNLGKNNEDGAKLKAFLAGPRWASLMGNIERGIKGPFMFGDKPCFADFCLAAHIEVRKATMFDKIKAQAGIDVLQPWPKVCGVADAIQGLCTYNTHGMGYMREISDEIVACLK